MLTYPEFAGDFYIFLNTNFNRQFNNKDIFAKIIVWLRKTLMTN